MDLPTGLVAIEHIFTAEAGDRAFQSQRSQVVHITRPHAQAPKRPSSKLVGCVLRTGLNDPVAGSDVMQQKITERMDHFVSQCVGNGECAAVHDSSGGSRGDGFHVTDVASDILERLLTCERVRVTAIVRSRGGAFVPRMNCAK